MAVSIFKPSPYLESTGAIPFVRPETVVAIQPPPGHLEANGSLSIRPRAKRLSIDERVKLGQGERIEAGGITAINLFDDNTAQLEIPQESVAGAGVDSGQVNPATGQAVIQHEPWTLWHAGEAGYNFDPETWTWVPEPAAAPEPLPVAQETPISGGEGGAPVASPAPAWTPPPTQWAPTGCQTNLLNPYEEIAPGVYVVVSEHLSDQGTWDYVIQW